MVILLKEWSLFIGLLKIGEFINESHGFKMTVTESLYHEKAIYLSGGAVGALCQPPDAMRKEAGANGYIF